jgi:anaphase-promoting complex subunit 10
VEFGSWETTETVDPETGETHSSIEGVRGWVEVPLKGVGGRETRYHEDGSDLDSALDFTFNRRRENADGLEGGDVLKAMVVQVRICENHQNGKDTHVRGFQVFARDHTHNGGLVMKAKHGKEAVEDDEPATKVVGLEPADWMGEPEIR